MSLPEGPTPPTICDRRAQRDVLGGQRQRTAIARALTTNPRIQSVKVNRQVLDAWVGILKRVPNSRLLLKTRWLHVLEMRERVRNLLEQRGIARDRVELMGKLPTSAEHLAAYGSVDIALDTYPCNGATTTCEALWMGVPVVTLTGDRHTARVGASMLSRVGLEGLVADRPQDYIETAARLAADLPGLARLRANLRGASQRRRCATGPGFTRQLEATFRTMWREWCATGDAGGRAYSSPRPMGPGSVRPRHIA